MPTRAECNARSRFEPGRLRAAGGDGPDPFESGDLRERRFDAVTAFNKQEIGGLDGPRGDVDQDLSAAGNGRRHVAHGEDFFRSPGLLENYRLHECVAPSRLVRGIAHGI